MATGDDAASGPVSPIDGNVSMTRKDSSASEAARPVVAFDFDGTLTVRDSFTAFLAWQAGRWRHLAGMVRLAPDAAAYLANRDRGKLKAAAVREFLRGLPRAELEARAEAFTRIHAPALLRPDALQVWEGWRRRGAVLTIVTASPASTVAPFARALGAEVLLGTELAFDAQDRVAGGFDGANCRGDEKVRRLRERFGDDVRLAAAYGDTSGDSEMLRIADEAGYRVFTARP